MGVARDGLVQAVKVLATEQALTRDEKAAYRAALRQLAGTDLGPDVSAWARFWEEHGARLQRERASRCPGPHASGSRAAVPGR